MIHTVYDKKWIHLELSYFIKLEILSPLHQKA